MPPNNYRAPVRTHADIIDRDGVMIPVVVRSCSKCGAPRDGLSTSSMCKACERAYRYERRNGTPPAGALGAGRTLPGAGPARTPVHRDAPDIVEPALPVPQARFVPVIRREPMRRSTRAERYAEMSSLWRDMLVPFNCPTSELTEAERKRLGR